MKIAINANDLRDLPGLVLLLLQGVLRKSEKLPSTSTYTFNFSVSEWELQQLKELDIPFSEIA